MPKDSIENVKQLQVREHLYLMQDLQNAYDPNALLLRNEKRHIFGYCPQYLTADLAQILKQNSKSVVVEVEKVNPVPNPMQFRILCKMIVKIADSFEFLSGGEYQPLVSPSFSLASE